MRVKTFPPYLRDFFQVALFHSPGFRNILRFCTILDVMETQLLLRVCGSPVCVLLDWKWPFLIQSSNLKSCNITRFWSSFHLGECHRCALRFRHHYKKKTTKKHSCPPKNTFQSDVTNKKTAMNGTLHAKRQLQRKDSLQNKLSKCEEETSERMSSDSLPEQGEYFQYSVFLFKCLTTYSWAHKQNSEPIEEVFLTFVALQLETNLL